ncbi:ABC transporter permease [Microaerobacter geothermalis]|uniref:ABC transporter permease n=1 Tax=Microaerobacter geothermalis TaxID=674972 RepID=UPI001F316567|nr:ABC transporter permease [Microaerobacter geothermalis]MCF6095208.1 ABC transporter permease [Microaerobacter geothermalis]
MSINQRFSIHRFASIMKKEFLQLKRDRASFGIAVMMPLVLLLLFGYAINTDVDHMPTAIWDQSKSKESRELIASFELTQYFDMTNEVQNYKQLQSLMDTGNIKMGLVIPPDYAYQLEKNEEAKIQILIDGSDPTAARTALSSAQLITQNKALAIQEEMLKKQGFNQRIIPIKAETRVLYNPDMDSTVFNIPGLIGLILQNVTALLTAFALVRERERGTMEQLVVTPVRPIELILGKLVPYVIIGLFSFSLVLFTGIYWFQVPVKGNILLLFVLGLLFLITTLSIGILISTIAKTQLQAMQMAFIIMLPSVLLSGFIFPRETMPLFVQGLGGLIPLTYFLEILRGIFLKGVSISYLWQETLILTLITLIICSIAVLRFRKKLE